MDETALAVIGGKTWSSGEQASCLEIEGLRTSPKTGAPNDREGHQSVTPATDRGHDDPPAGNPTILDDHGNLVRSLQHGDVRSRISVPNDDVGEPARRDNADFAIQTDEPGIATGVGPDCLVRRHADLINEQFRLFAVPPPMGK